MTSSRRCRRGESRSTRPRRFYWAPSLPLPSIPRGRPSLSLELMKLCETRVPDRPYCDTGIPTKWVSSSNCQAEPSAPVNRDSISSPSSFSSFSSSSSSFSSPSSGGLFPLLFFLLFFLLFLLLLFLQLRAKKPIKATKPALCKIACAHLFTLELS